MTILHKPNMRELPERIARRQMVIELHSEFIRFREERKDWDVSRESIIWKAAEIQARRGSPNHDFDHSSFQRRS